MSLRRDPALRSSSRRAIDHRELLLEVLGVQGGEAGQFSVLGPDPWQVLFSSSGEGFVNFLEGRRALVSWRSPVAPLSEVPELVRLLVEHATQLKKALFLIEVDEATRAAGADLAMTPLWTGAESFIDLSQWSTSGGRRQKIRWALNHAQRLGVSWREARPTTCEEDRLALARVEELWKYEREERRTDSFLRTSYLEVAEWRRYFVAEINAEAIASVTCTPINVKGWYLQDIVRVPSAPRGALEGAMAYALDTLRDDGYALVSNGPLPFWRPHEHWSNAHQLGPLGNRIMKIFDRQFRFGGINQFRSKLEPDWTETLYVLRSQRLITPWVARSLTQILNDPRPAQ
ncbi:MAG TPA: phosphatidylglycerol lysyltransferase domain-containing protein [Acidimicrobiales bacterium]|nr:phosphatidylglycerol lysyltransferase domain-containing protein [Acidimicrobiales bacterium]